MSSLPIRETVTSDWGTYLFILNSTPRRHLSSSLTINVDNYSTCTKLILYGRDADGYLTSVRRLGKWGL